MTLAVCWTANPDEYYSAGEHRSLLFARLQSHFDLNDKTILDYGCGNGAFARAILSHRPRALSVYDSSDAMLVLARRTLTGAARVSICSSPDAIGNDQFDLVFLILVWNCFSSTQEVVGNLSRIHAALKRGGQLVSVVAHPAFREHLFIGQRTNFNMRSYLSEGSEFTVTLTGARSLVSFKEFHWSIARMLHDAKAVGFCCDRLYEWPEAEDAEMSVPIWLCVSFTKRDEECV